MSIKCQVKAGRPGAPLSSCSRGTSTAAPLNYRVFVCFVSACLGQGGTEQDSRSGLPYIQNCAWCTLDPPVALVRVTHPDVAQPHSLTIPLLSPFDNNPNLQAIVLQLHDTDARAVVEHVKKKMRVAE